MDIFIRYSIRKDINKKSLKTTPIKYNIYV